MPRPIASVHLDIARFLIEVQDNFQNDAERLSQWTLSLSRSLALNDPSLNSFGAWLLNDANEFRKAETERKKQYRDKESHGKTVNPRNPVVRKKERKKDLLFDAIVFSFFDGGPIAKSDGSRIAKMANTLRERMATPEQVETKKQAYKILHPEWDLTPEAVVKHWHSLEIKPAEPKRHVPSF